MHIQAMQFNLMFLLSVENCYATLHNIQRALMLLEQYKFIERLLWNRIVRRYNSLRCATMKRDFIAPHIRNELESMRRAFRCVRLYICSSHTHTHRICATYIVYICRA